MRDKFASWLHNFQILVGTNWLLLGDLNFIRSEEDRNKRGRDLNVMFLYDKLLTIRVYRSFL
jgi:hypothetical protein